MQKSIYEHISNMTHDPIHDWKECVFCHGLFAITVGDIALYESMSPKFSGVTYSIPSPTLCPDCRQQRRLSFHNERKLYKSKCDATGKEIISIYSPDKNLTVYHQDYWWSEAWNPLDYGVDIDWGKGFFSQFSELSARVPKQSIIASECENSEFLNFVYRVKNCYLISAASFDEDCYYGNRVTYSKNCVDTFLVKKSENCYECTDAFESYGCFFSENIFNCRDSYYLKDCVGCSNCFLSANLQNKEFYIENVPYSEYDYKIKIQEYLGRGRKELDNMKKIFHLAQPRKSESIIMGENAFGNNIKNAKDVSMVFDGDSLENVKYSAFVDDVKRSQDINYGYGNTELQYECLGTGENATLNAFSINIWPNVHHIYYSDTCSASNNLFFCIGLRNASYCIFNKQYTREEYGALVPKIIQKMIQDTEWGEFFPSSMSPFGYNETVASEYFPITKDQVVENRIFNWSDYSAPIPKVEKMIPGEKLPDDTSKIPDDVLNWAIECEVTKRPFRITKQELEFYRKHNISIPKKHPDQRHIDRMNMRNPRMLFERNCDNCQKKLITSYSPQRPERVYCEICYNSLAKI